MGQINRQLLDSIQHDVDMLSRNPSDENLKTSILDRQVDLTAQQLDISRTQSADLVRSYTAAKAYSKGYDERELFNAMRADQQIILNWSNNPETIYGIDLLTANKLSFILSAGSGVLLTVAGVLFLIAAFTVGPTIAMTAVGASGVVATIGAIASSRILLAGGIAFLFSQLLGHFAAQIPMATNQMIDNGSIAPGLRLGTLKDIQATINEYKGNQSPGPFSKAEFISYAASLERKGIIGINNPARRQTTAYSRDALADVILYVYGDYATRGVKLTLTKIYPLITPHLILPAGVQAPAGSVSSAFSGAVPSAPAGTYAPTAQAGTTAQTKIFTGPLASGTLGASAEFYARPDDLIEDSGELTLAAQNNLAAFWQSLSGKVAFQVALVSSVKTRDGFTQKGAPIQVISGYTTAGKPKYKTVYHKFAVLTLKVQPQSGNPVTLATINLGPVNPVQFNASPSMLTDIAAAIKKDTFTSDVSQITEIVTSQAVSVSSTPTNAPPSAISGHATSSQERKTDRFGHSLPLEGEDFRVVGDTARSAVYNVRAGQMDQTGSPGGIANTRFSANGVVYEKGSPTPPLGPQTTVVWLEPGYTGTAWSNTNAADAYDRSHGAGAWERLTAYNKADLEEHVRLFGSLSLSANTRQRGAGLNAATLAEFYAANGEALPTVEIRSKLYEQAGLGAASTFVGTAEQNTKLLAWLKKN